MQHGVVRNIVDPLLQLIRCGKLAEHQEVRYFKESTVLRQHLNGIPTIAKNAAIAVNESNTAVAGRSVHERWIVGHEAEVVSSGLDLPQIHCPDCAVLNRQLVILGIAIISDRQAIRCHREISLCQFAWPPHWALIMHRASSKCSTILCAAARSGHKAACHKHE